METKPRIRVKAKSRPNLTVVPMCRPIDPDLTRVLDHFGQLVGDGRIVSISVAGVWHDGTVTTAFVNGGQLFTMIGAIRHLQRRVEMEIFAP